MHIRNNYIQNMYKILVLLKKKIRSFAINDKCKTIGDKLDTFCGISRYTASSENYLIDSIYRNITLSKLLVNVKDQNTNILPLIEGQTKNYNYATNYVKLMIHL